ncbi:MAG: phosphate ABC transporter permease PstA [Lachnospiraceae bacterium]
MKKNRINISNRFLNLSMLLRILVYAAALATVLVLASIIIYILVMGIPNLTPDLFRWKYNSENGSLMPALINTLIMIVITLLMAVPVGIGSAIYLVEYAKKDSRFVKIIRVTTETLSGIPSIVYGLFGYLCFGVFFDLKLSLLSGALTLAIMVLPSIMRTTEEALLSIPDSYRQGSFGLGAGKIRTIFRVVLPSAVPGILAGVILAIGRIFGETAALIYTAGTVAEVPESLLGSGRTLAVHMYQLFNEGLAMEKGYATAVVMLIFVLLINGLSNLIGKKLSVDGKE